MTEYDVVSTPLGPCAVAVRDGVVVRVRLGTSPDVPVARRTRLPQARRWVADWFAGRTPAVKLAPAPTAFLRRVYAAVRAIPRGSVRTYGEVARAAGSPGAARAVGQAMRRNQTLLFMPCHRVVAAGGLGGFSCPDGPAVKRRLLALEGVRLA